MINTISPRGLCLETYDNNWETVPRIISSFIFVNSLAITKDAGRFSQQQKVDSWPMAFGAHPVANDAWGCAVFDMNNKEE